MGQIEPEMVVEILKKHNVHISIEEARIILDFMYKLARIALTKTE